MKGYLSTLYLKASKEHILPAPDKTKDHELLPVLTPKTTIIYAHMGDLFGFQEFMAITAGHSNICIKYLGANKFIIQ